MEGSPRYKKYNKLGGIEKVFSRLGKRKDPLESIGQIVGVSRQSVRQDIIMFFGKEAYLEMKNQRKRLSTKTEIELDLQSTIRFIKQHIDSKNTTLCCMAEILSRAKRNEVPLITTMIQPFSRKSQLKFKLSNGKKVFVHTALALGNLSEHGIGLHRFRPRKVDADFYIFGICGEKDSSVYIFKFDEIKHIKSLNLRFKQFEKQSKYDYARDRWGILLKNI